MHTVRACNCEAASQKASRGRWTSGCLYQYFCLFEVTFMPHARARARALRRETSNPSAGSPRTTVMERIKRRVGRVTGTTHRTRCCSCKFYFQLARSSVSSSDFDDGVLLAPGLSRVNSPAIAFPPADSTFRCTRLPRSRDRSMGKATILTRLRAGKAPIDAQTTMPFSQLLRETDDGRFSLASCDDSETKIKKKKRFS